MQPREKPAVIILGSGPNRIGQGIEFDYSCVHASLALSSPSTGGGYETIMVNCNPETVSTDYDTSDRLYFEPLTLEDVLEISTPSSRPARSRASSASSAARPRSAWRRGWPTPASRSSAPPPRRSTWPRSAAPSAGCSHEAGLPAPKHGMASSFNEAQEIAAEIGYPVLVRPSYVLGGRGMEIVYDDETLAGYIGRATEISPEHPVLVDRFIDDAVEIDVDALYDGTELFLGGVMEHIEEAGIHSGDSSCALPPITLGAAEILRIREATEAIAAGRRRARPDQHPVRARLRRALRPRGQPAGLPHGAVRLEGDGDAAGQGGRPGDDGGDRSPTLRAAGVLPAEGDGGTLPADQPIAVKEAVMPFNRFRTPDGEHVDTVLGPEMKSTGEVMGFDADFGTAFAKAQAAAFGSLPTSGEVFVSMANRDKRHMIFPIKVLADHGFEILATQGTAEVLRRNGVRATVVRKHYEGEGPDGEQTTVQLILAGEIQLVINTPQRLRHRRLGPRRRLRDPHRRDHGQHPVHHHRPGARRRRAGHRGDARR